MIQHYNVGDNQGGLFYQSFGMGVQHGKYGPNWIYGFVKMRGQKYLNHVKKVLIG